MRKKTNEEYILELSKKNPEYISLAQYQGSAVKIMHKHLSCGYEWKVIPNSLLLGHGCPKCAGRMLKTKEQYAEELPEGYQLRSNYINAKTPVLHKHILCGTEWLATPSNILYNGTKCPKCSANSPKTTEQYIKELPEGYSLLDKYINNYTPIYHKHIACGHIWHVTPTSILKGSECPNCTLHGFNPMLPAYLYHVEFTYENVRYFKIGITKHENLSDRFGYGDWNNLKMKELWKKVYPLGLDARNKEKELLKMYVSFKINTGALKSGGNTETISISIEEPYDGESTTHKH